jgi:hypothetical protein
MTSLPVRTARSHVPAVRMGRALAFWSSVWVLAVVMAGSALVSPLYQVYQAQWRFSPTTLTTVFAVYAAALLAVLLVAGSLSDHAGRRPMMAMAMVAEAAAAAMFLGADGVGYLYAGRMLQGVATGAGVGAVGAALVEFAPEGWPALGGMVNASGSMGALAVGALGSGILVQYGPAPTSLVFWVLLGASLAGLALVAVMPEPVATGRVTLGHLRPRAGVPATLRRDFAAALPALVASWALGGLYFSLGPSIAAQLTGSTDAVWGGLVIALLTGAGMSASLLLRSLTPSAAMVGGSAVLAVGAAVTLIGISAHATAGLIAGSIVAGVGFGTGYLGSFRHLLGLASDDQRGALVASVYIVAYLSFSAPVIAAGIVSSHLGLHPVAIAYAAAVIGLAGAAIAGQRALERKPASQPRKATTP